MAIIEKEIELAGFKEGKEIGNCRYSKKSAYRWRDAGNQHHRLLIHFVACNETWEENGQIRQATWAWVSGTPITRKNVINRCNRAARHRWGIEDPD